MINLDPSIINQDAVRKKRRKKMLAYAITPVLMLLLAGIFFLRPGAFDILYGMNYDNEDAGLIVTIGNMQTKLNILEPYLAHYSAGTAYIRNNDGKQAEIELRESIKNNPPSDKICQVRTNLAYSIEMQADQESILKHYDRALVLYSSAEGVLFGDNCASKNDSQAESRDEKAENAKKRISDKRNKIVSEMNGKTDEAGDPNSNTDTEISEEQLDNSRNNLMNGMSVQDAMRRQQFSYGSGSGSGGGAFSNIEHW